MKFELINADDWEALYVDGKLVAQDHSVSMTELANAAKLDFSSRETTTLGYDYLADHGYFPETLDEFKAIENAS